jgi:hypothetical protein
MKIKFKTWHWHVIAVVFFVALSAIYFSPAFFDNKDLQQGDITSGLGMGKDAHDHYKKTGDYSYWSNAMFSGMPGNYTGGMPPTVNIFGYVNKVFTANMSGYTYRLLFMYLLGFYIFLLSVGCKSWLSIIGAVAYAFATYNLLIIDAGHASKCYAMAAFAPVLGGIILTYRGKYLAGALITLIFTGLNVAYNHQQISFYLVLTIIVLAVVYFIFALREKRLKQFFIASGILAASAGLAVLPALGGLIPTMDYAQETMRGGAVLKDKTDDAAEHAKKKGGLDIDYAYAWSYGKMESFTLLVPNLYGASSHYDIGTNSKTYEALRQSGQGAQFVRYAPMYWGDQPFTSGPVYAGAIICFLFILGLYLVPEREKWWLLIATMLAVFMSWGRHFPLLNEFLFYHLPLYNKFRTPSMSLIIANVTMVIMSMLTIKSLLEGSKEKGFLKAFKRPFLVSLGATGGVCLLFIVFGRAFDFSAQEDLRRPDWLVSALQEDRHSMLVKDSLRSLVFIAMGAALIWWWAKNKIKLTYFAVGMGALILIDLWQVDKRFLNNNSFVPKKTAKTITPTDVDKQILQDKHPNYRVLNFASSTFNESQTSYFHKSVGGYSPAKLRRYQDIIDHFLSGKNLNMEVINMLNTRYFILPDKNSGSGRVQHNPDAMGNCWFVDSIRWVNNPNEEIESLATFNPRRAAIVDTAWKSALPLDLPQYVGGDKDIITMDSCVPGYLRYTSSSAAPVRLAVFSEVYYKTWKAYIDGQEAPLVRVNYILRAVPIPQGNHIVELRCKDELALRWAGFSKWGSLFIGVALAGMLGGVVWQQRKKREKNPKIQSPKTHGKR